MRNIDDIRINKSVITVADIKDKRSDLDYWISQPPEERFAYVELLRQINYGKSATSARLQRILTFVKQA